MKQNIIIIKNMLGFVKPLKLQMFTAIFCGTVGHLLAISIPVLGIFTTLTALGFFEYNIKSLFGVLLLNSILRGIFAYLEQQRNHYIAFTILAIIRDKIFGVLRKLCPAKLEGKNRGNLITLITSDIELLEVFYAHTISPIAIASLISIIIASILSIFNPIYSVISLLAHFSVGVLLPVYMSRKNSEIYTEYREKNGSLASYYLDSLRGIDDILQLQNGQKRLDNLDVKTKDLENNSIKISNHEGKVNAIADFLVLFFSGSMLVISTLITQDLVKILLPTVIIMSSFGPFLSLSKLSVGLSKTLAAAKRVQDLLNETPEVEEIISDVKPCFNDIKIKDLNFAYNENQILNNINLDIEKNKITSIIGKSGSGKSTLVKLIMRFWNSNGINISDTDINDIDTKHLRKLQSYMTQESDIFSGSIFDNIKIGDLNATENDIILASKKASLHEFVMSLENGYNSNIGELGSTISGGERQRIGLARAFLHQADLLILDEPTSNLDSLNESIILNSIKQENKTTILISHRKSTLGVSNKSYEIINGNLN